MKESKERILSFDLLKAVALIYIIFGMHMDDYAGDILATTIGRTIAIASLGIFFFVSGFTLTRSCRKIENLADVRIYLKKRFVRIYPLYLFALILSVALEQITGREFLAGVFLLNSILNIHILTYWFLIMIFIFYLFLPVILYKYSAAKTLLLSFIFLTICVVLNNYAGLMDLRLTYYYPIFIWGVLCAQHKTMFHFLQKKSWMLLSVIFLIALTYIFSTTKIPWFKHVYIVGSLVFSISPLIVLGELFSELANSNFFVKLSYASFCMYLFHRIIFYFLLQIYTPGSNLLTVFYLSIIGFPLIFILSERLQGGYDYLVNRFNTQTVTQI